MGTYVENMQAASQRYADARGYSPPASQTIPAPVQQVSTSPSFSATDLTAPVGDASRDLFTSLFDKTEIAKEDWLRQEQQNINAYLRDVEQMKIANEFTASENEKQRAFDKEMASTEYQRAVEDLKKAGLNPILAYSQGGSSTPTHSPAVASSTPTGRQSSTYKGGDTADSLSKLIGVALMFAGKFVSNPKVAKTVVRGFGN